MASRLIKSERVRLKELRDTEKRTWRDIWFILSRAHTTVMREYNNNKKRWWHYDPDYAEQKAYKRKHDKKKQCKKIRMNNPLEDYIREQLTLWRSAECVAGRRNKLKRYEYEYFRDLTISWSSVRRFIHSKFAYDLKYVLVEEKLLKKHKKKAKRRKRKWWNIVGRTFVDARPTLISNKEEVGHGEVDFIVSQKGDSSVLLVIIDMLTKERYAYRLPNRKSKWVATILRQAAIDHWLKSYTVDNDLWFARHEDMWIPVYFCHTYSSREKWLVERANRWYRKYFPKKSLLKNISQEDVDEVTSHLNNLPMKCLGYLTPNEYSKQKSYEYTMKLQKILSSTSLVQ